MSSRKEHDPLLADRMVNMRPSPTLSANARAKELAAAGNPVIALTVGETDFDPEKDVVAKTVAALQKGGAGVHKYGLVPGDPGLKKAVADKYKRDNGLDGVDANKQVIISNGGKHVIFNAMMTTLNHGDEVIIPSPAWVSYFDIVEFAGGTPVEVNTGTGQFTPEELRLQLSLHPNAKWVFINSPSNPTGNVLSPQERDEIAGIVLEERARRCARRERGEKDVPDLTIMFDDIYEHIRFDGASITFGDNEKKLFADGGALYVNGVAKAYGMTGWRVGYGVGPEKLVKAMGNLQGQSTTNVARVAQVAAAEALNGDQQHLAKHCQEFKERRDKVLAKLEAIGLPIDKTKTPQGAFYVYVDVSSLAGREVPASVKLPSGHKTLETSQDIQDYFLESSFVGTVAGGGFHGRGVEDLSLRISYALEESKVLEALDRIGEAIGKLKPVHARVNGAGGGSKAAAK